MGRRADGRAGGDRRAASSSCSRPGTLAGKRVLVDRRRNARAARRRALRRQPLLGPDGRRARRGGAPPRCRRRAAGREPRRAGAAGRRGRSPTPTAEAMLDAALARADVDVALLAAAVADYRPAESLAGEALEETARRGRSSSSRPTDVARRARRAEASRPGARRLRRRARRRRASSASARMLDAKNADLVVFNDVSRADIGFRQRRERGRARCPDDGERDDAEGAEGRAIAAAILDEVGAPAAPVSCGAYERTSFQEGRAAAAGADDRAGDGRAREGEARSSPTKASIREALGIALLPPRAAGRRPRRSSGPIARDSRPTDDYAHYALGRALEKQGPRRRGQRHYKLAQLDAPGERAVRATRIPRPRRRRMRAVVQRVTRARRRRPGGAIGPGLCVLLGVAATTTTRTPRAARQEGRAPAHLRERRRASSTAPLLDTGGAALVVSQFTLHRRHREGQPAELHRAARPELAEPLCERVLHALRDARRPGRDRRVRRADGASRLVNDGPVTIVMDM